MPLPENLIITRVLGFKGGSPVLDHGLQLGGAQRGVQLGGILGHLRLAPQGHQLRVYADLKVGLPAWRQPCRRLVRQTVGKTSEGQRWATRNSHICSTSHRRYNC